MREVELKGVANAPDRVVAALVAAGAEPAYAGRLLDRRYDTAGRTLALRDVVLRVRRYVNDGGERVCLECKGPTEQDALYKVREECGTDVADGAALERVLALLGYEVTREIDRDIAQFMIHGATVRVERYPRMDALVEVEGEPETIEQAIAATGLDRGTFTTGRLLDFVRAFEARTGHRAAVSQRELGGDYRYSTNDA